MKNENDFFKGYVCATAILAAFEGDPNCTQVRDLKINGGITWEKCLEVGVEEWDLKRLFPKEWKDEEIKRGLKDFVES